MGLGTDLPQVNPNLRPGPDPFDGAPVMHVRALEPDVALLHVTGRRRRRQRLHRGGRRRRRAARPRRPAHVRERRGARRRRPAAAAISRIWLEGVVEAPRGAWPTGCHPAYGADLQVAMGWARKGAEAGVELLTP